MFTGEALALVRTSTFDVLATVVFAGLSNAPAPAVPAPTAIPATAPLSADGKTPSEAAVLMGVTPPLRSAMTRVVVGGVTPSPGVSIAAIGVPLDRTPSVIVSLEQPPARTLATIARRRNNLFI
jgi:hypothetical protein